MLRRPALVDSSLILDYFVRTEYINFADKAVCACTPADAECLSVSPTICTSLTSWNPDEKNSLGRESQRTFPFWFSTEGAILQLHTPPIEVVTVTSAMPVYLKA